MRRVVWCVAVACVAALVAGAPGRLSAAGNTDGVAEVELDGSSAALALAYYERGLELRDKAWALEQKAVDSKRAERLLIKAEARWTKAVVAFREAVANDPTLHEAYASLGYALRRLERYDDSLEAYDRALELAPSYVEAIEYRAEAYLGLGRLDKVRGAYMELFRLDRVQAATLMTAMESWVETQSSNSQTSAEIEEFSSWLAERAEIAGQTGKLTEAQDRSW